MPDGRIFASHLQALADATVDAKALAPYLFSYTMQEALGRHIIAEFYNCPAHKLNQVIAIEKAMVDSAQQAGATVINSTFHHFAPFGVSGVVVIQESHLAIHTWPEYGFAAIDLFTCGDTVSPWKALEVLKEMLAAGHISAIEMRRGQPEMLANHSVAASSSPEGENNLTASQMAHARKITRDLWFTERAGEIALSVKHEGELLFQQQSPWQKVEVLQTRPMGRMLVLDGVIATTDLDGFVIHEMAVHPALLSHPKPQKILVIGGGDGGTAQELLKHASVAEIIIIERDEAVVEAANAWFAQAGRLALSDKKVSLRIADAHEALTNIAEAWADVVIVDAYNPVAMNDPQWHTAFYQAVKRVLSAGGVAVFQMGSPWLHPNEYQAQYQNLCYNFGSSNISLCQASVPSYPTGLWTFAYASMGNYSPLHLDKARQKYLCEQYELQYYNEEIQQQMWALPNFLKKLCKPPLSPRTGS